jgi:hypothetical protein
MFRQLILSSLIAVGMSSCTVAAFVAPASLATVAIVATR